MTTILGGGPVVLAAVPDPYLHFGESRTYDYGPGADVRASATLSTLNRFKFGIDYRGGYFVTISGNKSHHYLHTASTSASVRIWKTLGSTFTPDILDLKAITKTITMSIKIILLSVWL
ncbi:hypothetical protein KUH03_03180 [Sphingobacterium sp. E70]|uniref:hypothetical protein n=1 Tax=Sphingobacterium sp. E70 TaxID=2853439 RepID=UPI00211C5061|nr:hypothetical protein [Sphingobacterium sp. E70]ULT25991.1 hypothetical protein KUH03_03180 [Sphingobacterium sp. E70]